MKNLGQALSRPDEAGQPRDFRPPRGRRDGRSGELPNVPDGAPPASNGGAPDDG